MIRQLGLSFSHGFSFHVDLVGVVDQPVQYGVGQGGVADCGVPLVDGQLAGGDGGAAVTGIGKSPLIDNLSCPVSKSCDRSVSEGTAGEHAHARGQLDDQRASRARDVPQGHCGPSWRAS